MKKITKTITAKPSEASRRDRVLGTLEQSTPITDAKADGLTAFKVAFAVSELLCVIENTRAELRRLDTIDAVPDYSTLIAPYSIGHIREHHTAILALATMQLEPLLAIAGPLGKQKLTREKRFAKVFASAFLALRQRAGVGIADRARELESIDPSATPPRRRARVRDEERKHRRHISQVQRHALDEENAIRTHWSELKKRFPEHRKAIDTLIEAQVTDRRATVLGVDFLDGKIAASFSNVI